MPLFLSIRTSLPFVHSYVNKVFSSQVKQATGIGRLTQNVVSLWVVSMLYLQVYLI